MEWKESLPEELRTAVTDINSIEDLAKAFVNTKAMQGNSIRMIGPDASAEDKAGVYQKVMKHMPELMLKPNPDDPEQMKSYNAMIGVPDNIDGYDVGEAKLPADVTAELKQLAVDTGMTKAQFKAYAKRMEEMTKATNENNEQALLVANAELKNIWGLATPDRLKVVENHLTEHGLGQLADYSPTQIQGHYNVAISLVGKPQAHAQPDPTPANAPDEAKAQLAEIQANPIFHDRLSNPVEHKRLVLKSIELRKQANPELYP